MVSTPMDLHGQALLDYWNGNRDATYLLRRDDGNAYPPIPVHQWFDSEGLQPLAVEACTGRVLDIGAGAGTHTLAIQERGLPVTAVDASPKAVEMLRQRGVRDARVGDLFDRYETPFDSILIYRNIGIVGDLEGLDRFLLHLSLVLHQGGKLITDSVDPRNPDDEIYRAYQQHQSAQGKYLGERTLRIEYNGLIGEWFDWIHVDPVTLKQHVYRAGFSFELLAVKNRSFLCAIQKK